MTRAASESSSSFSSAAFCADCRETFALDAVILHHSILQFRDSRKMYFRCTESVVLCRQKTGGGCSLSRELVDSNRGSGTPEWIRTTDLLLRRQTLYPAELRAHESSLTEIKRAGVYRPELSFCICLNSAQVCHKNATKGQRARARHPTQPRARTHARNGILRGEQLEHSRPSMIRARQQRLYRGLNFWQAKKPGA